MNYHINQNAVKTNQTGINCENRFIPYSEIVAMSISQHKIIKFFGLVCIAIGAIMLFFPFSSPWIGVSPILLGLLIWGGGTSGWKLTLKTKQDCWNIRGQNTTMIKRLYHDIKTTAQID